MAAAAVVDHEVLETGMETGLGVQNRSQAWGDGPTPVPRRKSPEELLPGN